ncbi:unnamed protein product [Protopolystoma xenopodis]|uniref:Uncharacterized protein n=1 Tax=Protopolystoma xenopodis TaxID=117903 RepID=A0A3S5CNG2_9PLAT|nr:unnamed protein product [Protopolystoma xenopodis]
MLLLFPMRPFHQFSLANFSFEMEWNVTLLWILLFSAFRADYKPRFCVKFADFFRVHLVIPIGSLLRPSELRTLQRYPSTCSQHVCRMVVRLNRISDGRPSIPPSETWAQPVRNVQSPLSLVFTLSDRLINIQSHRLSDEILLETILASLANFWRSQAF